MTHIPFLTFALGAILLTAAPAVHAQNRTQPENLPKIQPRNARVSRPQGGGTIETSIYQCIRGTQDTQVALPMKLGRTPAFHSRPRPILRFSPPVLEAPRKFGGGDSVPSKVIW
jgi:hypothetical protein